LKKARRSSVNHRKKPASATVIEKPAPTPSMPSIPVNEVMSFLRETRSALTWSENEMADSLNIAQAEAGRVIELLELQGYVKRSSADGRWMTTIDGEAVSVSKPPRFGRERVEKALVDLKDRIAAVNGDRRVAFHLRPPIGSERNLSGFQPKGLWLRFYRRYLRAWTVMRTPLRGRRVMRGSGTTGWPGTRRNWKRCAIVAITRATSSKANPCPIQRRGPSPNGK